MTPRSSPGLPALLAVLLLSSCDRPGDRAAHELLNAALWVQTSAEYRISCEQAYDLASLRLEEALADPAFTAALEQEGDDFADLPPAVVLDVDETVLDNSPYQGTLIAGNRVFDSRSWAEWAKLGAATPVPGALAFTRRATTMGVAVFYVTNRDHEVEEATRRNLAEQGFPLAEGRDCVLTGGERPEWTSDKSTRREEVARTHRILLLIGDDGNDFLPLGKMPPEERRRRAETHADRWGRSWILLPNPQYGSWEGALYGFDHDLGDAAKNRRKAGLVRQFR